MLYFLNPKPAGRHTAPPVFPHRAKIGTGGGTAAGIGGMVIAFLISPFGLPAVAGWIIEKLADLNYSLKCFLTD